MAWKSRSPCVKPDQEFVQANVTFSCLFTLDLALRLFAQRGYFFTSHEAGFNIFDIIVVISSVLESVATVFFPLCATTQFTFRNFLSTASMLRMGRLLRVIKVTTLSKPMMIFRDL